jgi:hypothetical protein
MWTVGEILPRIADYVDGRGVCLDTPEGKSRTFQLYNDICEELLSDDAWDGAIVDLGDHFAVARDLGADIALPLMVYSDMPEEGNAQITIQGTGANELEIWENEPGIDRQPGEVVSIVPAGFMPNGGSQVPPVITRNSFLRRPSTVTKTQTRGHVYLYGYLGLGVEPLWMATYRPDETSPSYRRYRIKQDPCSPVSVVARVDLRFVPAVSERERAMIQHRPAFEIYAQALAARRASQFDDYQKFRNSALAKLNRAKEKKHEMQTHTVSVSRVRSGAMLSTARRSW